MLRVQDLVTAYGKIEALKGVSLEVAQGSITCLLGPNGAGKTTLMMTIAGILKPRAGSVSFFDHKLSGLPPHAIVARGIALVPEGRRVFAGFSVEENLRLGLAARSSGHASAAFEEVYALFPVLEEFRRRSAGALSTGATQ